MTPWRAVEILATYLESMNSSYAKDKSETILHSCFTSSTVFSLPLKENVDLMNTRVDRQTQYMI